VFVHGCFWHAHQGCARANAPKTRSDYWQAKFARNIARDARQRTALLEAGWRVLTIWECQAADPDSVRALLESALIDTFTA
jgi:DNA mismatch endonuclease (patch repair protein)